MTKMYVPYTKDIPATISVNGHTLVIISRNSQVLRKGLDVLGGDSIREITLNNEPDEEALVLANLATTIKGGVVLAPSSMPLSTMIASLEKQLPWLH